MKFGMRQPRIDIDNSLVLAGATPQEMAKKVPEDWWIRIGGFKKNR